MFSHGGLATRCLVLAVCSILGYRDDGHDVIGAVSSSDGCLVDEVVAPKVHDQGVMMATE